MEIPADVSFLGYINWLAIVIVVCVDLFQTCILFLLLLICKVLLLYICLWEQGVCVCLCVSCSFMLYIKMEKAYVSEV